MFRRTGWSHSRRAAVIAAAVPIVAAGLLTIPGGASAAPGCSVDYRIQSQWQGGFSANVTIRNLGDPIDGWRLAWRFPGDSRFAQGWNAQFSANGADITASNVDWNRSLPTNGTANFGFNGAGGAGIPTTFTLNGTTCTGGTAPTSTTTTTPPTTTTTTTNPPTSGWNPPANLVTPLNQVWQHQESTYGDLYGFRNYGWDQVFVNGGYLNFCVRWDSSAPVSATLRDQIHAKLGQQYKKWTDAMAGHNNWPYAEVPIKVVGWAVRDRNTLQWNDNSVDIYVNNINENAPQCAPGCGRFFNRDGTYPNCPGGTPRHYDQSLWLTAGMGGGAGGDWGQRMGSEYFVNSLNSSDVTILLHEIGHTFGLDDFYDWTPTGVTNFIMLAGSSASITDFDRWMLRDWWRHLKSRYGR